ncbi:MAG TPA: hypothetical protein PLI46_13680 [Methanosarcina thermophila]|nr:hypothetical protein [Methanosarcina thermophila]
MTSLTLAISTVYGKCPYIRTCERMYGTMRCNGEKAPMKNCGLLEYFVKYSRKDWEIWEV